MIPEKIRRFEIIEKIGEGASSIVYHAFDPTIKRHVALKVLKTDLITNPASRDYYVKLFYREARIAGNLSHPNIAVLYDIDETDDGTPFLTLEYIEGQTLEEIIRQGPPYPYPSLLKMAHKIASALHHAHQIGIVHRDLKPANVRVLPEYDPKILDFGFARWREMLTTDHLIKGTPLYMSPEQIQGKELTPRTDLFAYGVMLWEMVIGIHPFMDDTVDRVIHRIVHEPPGPVSPEDLKCLGLNPEHWESFFHKALHKNPEKRFTSALHMVRAFEQMMSLAENALSLSYPLSLTKPERKESVIELTPENRIDEMESDISEGRTVLQPADATNQKKTPMVPVAHTGPNHLLFFVTTMIFLMMGLALGGVLAWLKVQKPPIEIPPAVYEHWSAYTPNRMAIHKPVQRPGPSTLKIESNPTANLILDGQPLGDTPQAMTLKDDLLHEIQLEHEGYQTIKQYIHIPSGTGLIVFSYYLLKPVKEVNYGTLVIHSSPSGAMVTLDREPQSPTPLILDNLRRGNHRLRIEKEGYETTERLVYITPGVAQVLTIRLEPIVRDVNAQPVNP